MGLHLQRWAGRGHGTQSLQLNAHCWVRLALQTPAPVPLPLQAFAADLEKLFSSLQAIDAELIVQAGAGGTVSASVAADDAAVNRFLLDLVR